MYKIKQYLILIFFAIFWVSSFAAKENPIKVEPAFWWVGMQSPNLQLMVHGENISKTDVVFNYPGVELKAVSKVENPNYIFIDLFIEKETNKTTMIKDLNTLEND